MNKEQIKSTVEELAADALIEISSRKLRKLVNLVTELSDDSDITLEEIKEDIQVIAGDDADDWDEFTEELANFILFIDEETQIEESEEDD
jgi:hypothetical protein